VRSKHDQDIVQARLLYTALIKAMLIAWAKGCPIANPHKRVYELSDDKTLIINALLTYFNEVPCEIESEAALPPVAPREPLTDAEQLTPVLTAISDLHNAVRKSGQIYASDLVGETENETVKNLIDFFTNPPEFDPPKRDSKNGFTHGSH
jgi:hypothetical protein